MRPHEKITEAAYLAQRVGNSRDHYAQPVPLKVEEGSWFVVKLSSETKRSEAKLSRRLSVNRGRTSTTIDRY